jgi:ribA/ribD-fused uncharacterized protein
VDRDEDRELGAEPYSVSELRASIARGWEPDFLFFWGHTPKATQTYVGHECLSQWYPSPFVVGGLRFATAEHFMMHGKALLFGDEATAVRILEARHPAEAKALGRKVRDFDEAVWKGARFEVVVAGSVAKFSQNPALRSLLLATKLRVLVEASPRDAIWGIGMAASNPAARSPDQWRGLNLLGFALMRARRELAAT